MLDGIDALVALLRFGTVSEAATRLRLTQSAVSKRLQALAAEVGYPLFERDGRRLRPTPRALELAERARPLVAELRALARPVAAEGPARFSLALADSIASSWGPAVVRRALAGELLELHAHRSVLVIESVRLGRYDIGLCTEAGAAGDLVRAPLCDEPMVLVKPPRGQPLITIEPSSATFRAIAPLVRARHPKLLAAEPVYVESFAAVIQMVRAGFGGGLVPLGLALERLPTGRYRELAGVARPVSLWTRKTVHQLPAFTALAARLAAAARARFQPSAARG
jgi:DNA-binding transcriptional LysR family regulator